MAFIFQKRHQGWQAEYTYPAFLAPSLPVAQAEVLIPLTTEHTLRLYVVLSVLEPVY